MRWAVTAAAALLALLLPALTVAAAPECATAQYIATVEAADAALRTTIPDVTSVRHQLTAAQQAANPPTVVLGPVIDALSATPPDVDTARGRLDAIVAVLSTPSGATCHVDPAPARAALHDVYASPVFAGLDRSAQPSLLSRIASFIGGLVDGAARRLGPAGSVALITALVVAALGYAAYRLRGQMGGRRARGEPEPAGESDDPDAEWRAAMRAAARAEYREAVRRAFRSALLAVAVRGRVAVDPSWTTRELLRNIAADADLLTALAPAAAAFDSAWYSGKPVERDEWEQSRQRCEAVRALARARRPAPR
ncbi:MAG: DUF4129 domain-containing protein [Candidatus Dormibacteraeota bacterium]|nr:DUF4129 domain-containing protein [Candidatus Dormibacteraeota bacterium]MBV9525629.1 DUF4129 domain-containing protein [Candidatus Dormibacteraeota bacterium]